MGMEKQLLVKPRIKQIAKRSSDEATLRTFCKVAESTGLEPVKGIFAREG